MVGGDADGLGDLLAAIHVGDGDVLTGELVGVDPALVAEEHARISVAMRQELVAPLVRDPDDEGSELAVQAGGVVGDDFNSISNALKSNDIDLISQANFKTLKAIATTLEKIYDGPTALAQVDRLKQLEQLVKLSNAAMKRVKPTAAQKRQIQQKYAVQASQALSAYNKEVARVTKNAKIPQAVKLQLQKTMQLGK